MLGIGYIHTVQAVQYYFRCISFRTRIFFGIVSSAKIRFVDTPFWNLYSFMFTK